MDGLSAPRCNDEERMIAWVFHCESSVFLGVIPAPIHPLGARLRVASG
jgi:hypothetical protein